MRWLLTSLASLFLGACATSGPNFVTMSEQELHAYNAERPVAEQVYCFERRDLRSYIPRRHCATARDLVEEVERAASQLDVMQPSSGYNVLSGYD